VNAVGHEAAMDQQTRSWMKGFSDEDQDTTADRDVQGFTAPSV
jgi:hypothetical protein